MQKWLVINYYFFFLTQGLQRLQIKEPGDRLRMTEGTTLYTPHYKYQNMEQAVTTYDKIQMYTHTQ